MGSQEEQEPIRVNRGWVWKIVPGGFGDLPPGEYAYDLDRDYDDNNYYSGTCPLCWNYTTVTETPFPAATAEEETRLMRATEDAHVCGDLNPDGADTARLI